MVYIEYEMYMTKFLELQKQFDQVLTEKERLFTKILPKSMRYNKGSTQSNNHSNTLENYIVEMDEKKINECLTHLKNLLTDRKKLLDMKEKELRMSRDKFDRVYVYKFLDGYGPKKIARILNYSKSQIYRLINSIQKRCDEARKSI